MPNPTDGTPRHLAIPGQLLAWFMIIFPVLGVLLTNLVPGPEGAMRRVRVLGLIADNMAIPLLGFFLGVFLAEYFRQRRLRWCYMLMGGLAGLAMLIFAPVLLLDAFQIRGSVEPGMLRLYTFNAARSIALLVMAGVILMLLAVMMWRGLRGERPDTVRDSSPLVRSPGSTRPQG